MKVAVLPSDEGAVAWYRLLWPAHAVQAARPDWEVRIYDVSEVRVAWWKGEVLVEGMDLDDLDLIVIQRVGKAVNYAFINAMQQRGIAVVIDTDDALWCIDRDNGAHRAWNQPGFHWKYLDRATAVADLTTVTTKGLEKRYASHGRVEVIPNGLPDHAYPAWSGEGRGLGPVVVGWSGTKNSHPHDLEVVGGALSTILDEDDKVMVQIVGNSQWAAGVLGVPEDRLINSGPVPFEGYHEALRTTDVGIVPLQDTLFNRCKSWLKAMEYSAAGAHVIASDIPANGDLAKTASTIATVRGGEEVWMLALREALKNVRTNPGRVARAASRDMRRQSINARAEEWVSAWERAVNRRRSLDS